MRTTWRRPIAFQVEPIRRRQLDRLRTSLREIETETNYSNSIIDRLLINTSERPVEDHEFQYFSAQSCVIDALHRYPFVGSYERDLISLDLDRNFVIHAPHVLVVHVLFNLLKNGIYYVHKAGKGELTVTIVQSLNRRTRDHRRRHRHGNIRRRTSNASSSASIRQPSRAMDPASDSASARW